MTDAELDAHVRTALDGAFAMITPKPRKRGIVFSGPRKPRKRKTYVDVLFADTIVGSMLRTVHMRGAMPQADFMTLYHKRCNRDKPSRSSFANNFQRYVTLENLYGKIRTYNQPLGCLDRYQVVPTEDAHGFIAVGWGSAMPALTQVLAAMDVNALTKAENTLERIFTRDDDSESLAYLEALRAEMRVRSKRWGANA